MIHCRHFGFNSKQTAKFNVIYHFQFCVGGQSFLGNASVNISDAELLSFPALEQQRGALQCILNLDGDFYHVQRNISGI